MILQDILEHKLEEVTERENRVSLPELLNRMPSAPTPRPLLLSGRMSLIAEVKRRSPSKGELAEIPDPLELARAYERGGASAISVLTDESYFGGSFDDLRSVRETVDLPVLCKDFVLGPYQLYEARCWGADIVLLIVAALDDRDLQSLYGLALDLGMAVLVEVHDQHELARALAIGASLIGINNRDLTDFSIDLLTTEYLAPLIPDDVAIVSESGIATVQDVQRVARAGARAVLVGEALVLSGDPAGKIRELLG